MSLPDAGDAGILRAAGVPVVELAGWATRGESDGLFAPRGLLLHHDGMGLGFDQDPANDLNVPQYMSQNGVGGAQKWVSRLGVWFMLAAGRKWHAGLGIGIGDIGRDEGNSYLDGIETDHTFGDAWPAVQVASITLGSAALVQAHSYRVANCGGHREYTRDTGRKPDPENFDLDGWRSRLLSPLPLLTAEFRAQLAGHSQPTGDDDLSDALDYLKSDAFLDAVAARVHTRHLDGTTGSLQGTIHQIDTTTRKDLQADLSGPPPAA